MKKSITLKNGQEIVFPKGKRFAILYKKNKRNVRWLTSFHSNQKLVCAKRKELHGMFISVIDNDGAMWFPSMFRNGVIVRLSRLDNFPNM